MRGKTKPLNENELEIGKTAEQKIKKMKKKKKIKERRGAKMQPLIRGLAMPADQIDLWHLLNLQNHNTAYVGRAHLSVVQYNNSFFEEPRPVPEEGREAILATPHRC